MNYEEFKQEVADRIKEFLPEKYENADVSIQTVVMIRSWMVLW